MKRFLLGTLATGGLAFVPCSAITAISVWVFANYDPKLGRFGTWMLASHIAGVIAIAAFLGFAIAFPLLHRLTRGQSGLRYLIAVAVPVGMIYLLIPIGIVGWLFDLVHPQSFIGCIPIGVLAYLPGLLGAVAVTLIGI